MKLWCFAWTTSLRIWYNNVVTVAKIDNDMTSPREAAIGVAILSGLMFNFWDVIMTNIITAANRKLAIDAVDIPPLIKTSAFIALNSKFWVI